jgi:hypothetical protein
LVPLASRPDRPTPLFICPDGVRSASGLYSIAFSVKSVTVRASGAAAAVPAGTPLFYDIVCLYALWAILTLAKA